MEAPIRRYVQEEAQDGLSDTQPKGVRRERKNPFAAE